jgi:uncharacterized repeat protein (TIGR01451 family)
VTVNDPLAPTAGLNWAENSSDCSITAGVLSCSFGDLGPGDTRSVHLTSTTTQAACSTINNTASVATTNDGSAQASASVVVNCGDISITKTADQDTVSAGDSIGFVITVTNNGAGTARGVTVNDPLAPTAGLDWAENSSDCSISGGVLSCSFGDLGPGAFRTVHLTSTTTNAACGLVNNTASVATTNDGSAQASASVTINCGDISITKTADQDTVSAGDPIGFVITVKNNGTGTARGVTLNDPLANTAGLCWAENSADCSIAAGVLSCTFGDLAPNATRSVHLTSPTTSASCGTINNTASVATTNDGSDDATDSVTVQCGAIDLTKTADNASVSAGSPIGFTLVAANTGVGAAKTVVVSDTLPVKAGLSWSIDASASDTGCTITTGVLTCDFGTIAGGGSKHVHITSPTTAASCATISNTGTVTTGNAGGDTSTASTRVDCPNLGLAKVADNASVNAGSQIGFRLIATNSGAGAATNVVVTDTLPANAGLSWSIDTASSDTVCSITTGVLTCNFGTIAAGTSKRVHITSPTTTATCGQVINTGNLTSGNGGTGQASASVGVGCPQISQIAPTATTCEQFAGGTAATLTGLNYTVKGNKINSVSPGVFFYWVKVTSLAGANTFTINQAITSGNFTKLFAMTSGSAAFGPACAKAAQSNVKQSTSGATTTVTFTAPQAGQTYYLGVKYDSTSVGNVAPPTGNGTATYAFVTSGVGGSGSGLSLSKK